MASLQIRLCTLLGMLRRGGRTEVLRLLLVDWTLSEQGLNGRASKVHSLVSAKPI